MSRRTLQLTDPVLDNVLHHGTREHPALAAFRAETAAHPERSLTGTLPATEAIVEYREGHPAANIHVHRLVLRIGGQRGHEQDGDRPEQQPFHLVLLARHERPPRNFGTRHVASLAAGSLAPLCTSGITSPSASA